MALSERCSYATRHREITRGTSFWRFGTNSPLTEAALKPGDDWIPSSTCLGIIVDISTGEENDNPN